MSEFKSYAVVNALRGSTLPPTQNHVLRCMLDRANPRTGECYASGETLASDSGLGVRAVLTAVRGLRAAGILVPTTMSRRARSYTFDPSAIRHEVPDADFHPAPGALHPDPHPAPGALHPAPGALHPARGADDPPDPPDPQIHQIHQQQEEGPYRVEGNRPSADGTATPLQVAHLLSLQRAYDEELMPPPQLNDRNAKAIERAVRQGWTVDELEELMHQADGRIQVCVWSFLLSPKMTELQEDARTAAREAEARRAQSARPIDYDPAAEDRKTRTYRSPAPAWVPTAIKKAAK